MSDASPSSDDRNLPRLGSYQILRQLGSGGMSNVYEARHTESGSLVVLKVLPKKLAQNVILLQRFLREAKSAENLDHPNIAAIYDRGFDQGRHYLVLEHVEGKDLFDRVRHDGPLTTPVAVSFIREVALGLEYAAKQGMIHRDVKPANLLMAPDGHAKIIDLGLALMADEEDERVTRDGTTVGTVDYMSPEQARDSRKINERSDIYSLGCTLHYLMTGSPPFPGGNLADKLARHHSAAVPDVRDRNPDVPADFARLIQRMMAKKPEQRFADYRELINALDQIGTKPTPLIAGTLPDVLIDESEDDDDYLELTVAASPPPVPAPASKSLAPKRRDPPTAAPTPPEISLAELAALDDDPVDVPPKRREGRSTGPSPTHSSAVVDALLEESTEDDLVPGALRRSGDELPLQTWITAGIMVGLLLAIVGFGVRFALSFMNDSETKPVVASESQPATEVNEVAGSSESGTYPARINPVVPTGPSRKPAELVRPVAPSTPQPPPVSPSLREVAFSEQLMTRLGFAGEKTASAVSTGGKVTVRRLAEPGDPTQTASISNAFGRPTDEVEISDLGPFHEDDFQLAGKSRVVRGKGGLRPIIKVEATRQALIREQEAKFLLGLNGIEQLTLEGLDLVVDVRDLPLTQSTLFLCRGVDLTLRDCSITIVNAEDRRNGFAVFRLAGGPRPNRLRLERTLIRGPIQTLAHLAAGQAAVTLDRSVIAGANGPLIQFDPAERVERSLQLLRSLLVTRGPAVAWTGKPSSTVVRALGTTFAHIEAPGPAPLWVARNGTAADVRDWLDYDGEANRYFGWAALAQWGSTPASTGSVRGGLQSVRPEVDQLSVESLGSWPAATIAETISGPTYAELLPDFDSTLQQVAAPHPFAHEMTVDLFARLPAPKLLDDFTNPVGIATPPRPTVNLTFDAQPGRRADLGLFLKAEVTDASKRYLVRIQGATSQPMTPVRLPNGVSLAIIGPGGEGSASPIPVFVVASPGLALIELHGGDLAIANVGFTSDGANRTLHWLLVEDSLLAVRRCRYRDIGPPDESTGPAAIAFSAGDARPTATRSGGFKGVAPRPIASLENCWIWTSRDAVAAQVSRGTLELDNCLIVAGQTAFRLKSTARQPAELEADLTLENCTVVDDQFGVVLESALSPTGGEGRPWVIVTRSSVFPRIGREGGSLLNVDPVSFGQGGLFWQSSNDLYEVSRFLLAMGSAPGGVAPAADLKRHWVDLWGITHTRGDRGPDVRRLEHILHFRDKERQRTSKPTPQQLELDPKLHSDQGVNFKLLPPLPKL